MLLMGWVSGCASRDKMYEGICQGIYDGSNQIQEMKNPESIPPQAEEPITYEQYKRERQEMLKDQNRSPAQQ
jgi:hypothetical protein